MAESAVECRCSLVPKGATTWTCHRLSPPWPGRDFTTTNSPRFQPIASLDPGQGCRVIGSGDLNTHVQSKVKAPSFSSVRGAQSHLAFW